MTTSRTTAMQGACRSSRRSTMLCVIISTCILTACAQTPTKGEESAQTSVIKESEINEPTPDVAVYSDEDLRRTGKQDAGKALKKLDPRIN